MANEYKSGKTFRYFFIISAVIIAIASVWVTNVLVNKLKEEERKKIEIWAESVALIASQALLEDTNSESFNNDYAINYDKLLMNLIEGNTTIPVILIDNSGKESESKNIQIPEENKDEYLKSKIKKFADKHDPIEIKSDENHISYVYYDDSTVLKQLQLFPFVQLTVVFIFIIISFLALNSTQKAEQNRVWVGLSKETAHQLGTPISSLMAWVEYLKTKDTDTRLLDEMDKDVQRLKTIAERFSKIGSNPDPQPMDLEENVRLTVEYMGRRISSKVSISTQFPNEAIPILMNESLFGWVIENLIKNAVDAMDGQGAITISVQDKGKKAILDISDTGKGIPKSKFNAVFHPGYTTKKRGWGLGLSLVKRIIESYQKGKIYVYKSEVGKGATFRIELNKIS
ncbi:two-component sensor histidine kinase [Bacteroidia bacterium]|nr:two-component sensor histidine kinase [Bacteroidia bacterium]GHT86117.1 two-component sensor histidine kinase [Bacteroidia bacterium]GHV70471.1 two-component sensor histidine kinase [Bacteroidia bacterium]